ncbi:MAG: DUF4124 domain-containing protein [Deltaproteobacteria bacterium]|nr:DUF4124 domain-containing protein [Deltaproteobacteria bacterium]
MRAVGAALLLLVLAHPVAAEMVKWVDEKGTTHFVESVGEIPAKYRTAAQQVPEYTEADERVRIIPSEPEEEESSGWFGWGAAAGDKASGPKSGAKGRSKGMKVPEFSFTQALGLIVVQFFASIAVLSVCTALIGERVENLGMKAFGAIFAQRFLMFAAFLWISHTTMMSFVPQSMTMGDLARVLMTPVLAELGIMTMILRYTICDVFARAIMLSIVFCVVDALAQGALFLGAVVLAS